MTKARSRTRKLGPAPMLSGLVGQAPLFQSRISGGTRSAPAPGIPLPRRSRRDAEMGPALNGLITFHLAGLVPASTEEMQTMGNKTKVVVRGGGENLYEVSESSGWFYAYKVSGLLFSSRTSIGKAKTFDQALDIIKSHSGRGIEKVE